MSAARVQRIVSGDVPILHLEPDVPTGSWNVIVDGLVERPVEIAMDEIHSMGGIGRRIDLHCVWGWSRPDVLWEGVHLNAVVAGARPSADASHVLVQARGSPYASCMTLAEARDSVLAWRADGKDLRPDRGWPLRFVSPGYKWAYKSVKWVERLTFLDRFRAGFWEERVGDPVGDIPWSVLQLFGGQKEAFKGARRRP